MKRTLALTICLFLLTISCSKEPYELKAYHAKAVVIGEEKCRVDPDYNFWLLDLSIENNSPEQGDTINYNGTVYNHAFKAIYLDDALKQPGKKISFDFNFESNNPQKSQTIGCDSLNAETFLLINILPFHESEIK